MLTGRYGDEREHHGQRQKDLWRRSIGSDGAAKQRRVDSNDCYRRQIHADGLANYVVCAAELAMPEVVADDRDGACSWSAIVGRLDGSAHLWLHLHLRVKVTGDKLRLTYLRRARGSNVNVR